MSRKCKNPRWKGKIKDRKRKSAFLQREHNKKNPKWPKRPLLHIVLARNVAHFPLHIQSFLESTLLYPNAAACQPAAFSISKCPIRRNSRMMKTRARMAAAKSAMGPAYITPSIPKNMGNGTIKGKRKMICLVRDIKMPILALPMAVKSCWSRVEGR